MATGRKTGGRQKGVCNKRTHELIERIESEFPGYHPVMAMAEVANQDSFEALAIADHANELAEALEIEQPIKIKLIAGHIKQIAEDAARREDLKFQCNKEIAQYLEPKRKATELTIEEKHEPEYTSEDIDRWHKESVKKLCFEGKLAILSVIPRQERLELMGVLDRLSPEDVDKLHTIPFHQILSHNGVLDECREKAGLELNEQTLLGVA